jgi:ferredoxin
VIDELVPGSLSGGAPPLEDTDDEQTPQGYSMNASLQVVAAVLCLSSAGCASVNPQSFKGPTGGQAYLMTCSGMGRSLIDCYRKASELCPDSYQVIEQRTGTVAVPTPTGVIAGPQYSLAVECKR